MTTYENIIGRLEKATGPDRELDGDIAMALNLPPPTMVRRSDGWCWYVQLAEGDFDAWAAPHLTASLDATVALVERMLPDHEKQFGDDQENARWWAKIGTDVWDENFDYVTAAAKTGPLAILLALFRALQERK